MHTYVNFVSHGQTLLQQERKSYPHTCYLSLLIVIIRINELTTSQLVSSKFQVHPVRQCIEDNPPRFCKMKFFIQIRGIATSSVLNGKRNFRKFVLPERGTQIHKERLRAKTVDRSLLYKFRPRDPGYYTKDGKFVFVPEMQPELVVPDLTDFKLKPYVSYRVTDIAQSEFTPHDLFLAVYSEKIVRDMKEGKLDDQGNPKEPSPEEKLTSDEAWVNARRTGADIFAARSKREEEEKYDPDYLPYTSYL
ncbi:ribosomal protein L41 [Nesidiocoris tenuis]|uniref:Ribosomal protein L41 n=1 Tax=Nesidiocoris tenuis TaxID=355587 RepID=A0ABN7B5R7_9HEMI|nr:ribosomal protein L41 [Nesidiocoris tenuis]